MSNPPQMEKRPANGPKVPKESAYEQLEERSEQLTRERENGGPGTAQPPDAPKPLLHPEYSETHDDPPDAPAPPDRKKKA